ncbi:MAG: hypothetical protein ACRDBO_00860 [Lachnospiraceae bacterium]
MNKKRLIYYGIPLLGTLLCLWYIKAATCNIVYTDYIRLVNSYLPDVWNPEKFLVPDVLTRIPVHYLGRIINVTFFGYSTTFDMVLGVLGLGLSGFVLAGYCSRRRLGLGWYLLLMVILYGLNKWEMLTNGTGWGHFLAFALFYYHYIVIDRVVSGMGKNRDKLVLWLLPTLITLGVAGPYCAVYSATIIIFYTAIAARKIFELYQDKEEHKNLTRLSNLTEQIRFWLFGCISVMLPLFLYLWSNSYAVEDHAGAVDITLKAAVSSDPGFFLRFLLKSLASMLIGEESLKEWVTQGMITDGMVYAIGLFIAAGYVLALYLNWCHGLYKKTILPLILLVAGMGNHAIILVSRYIFLKEDYGMSSRYALQYQVGILGIVLTLGLLWKQMRTVWIRLLAAVFCAGLICGHGYTNWKEWKKAPYREEYVEKIAQAALGFEELSDDELRGIFDYRREEEDSGAKVRQALTILKEQKWNVFGRE